MVGCNELKLVDVSQNALNVICTKFLPQGSFSKMHVTVNYILILDMREQILIYHPSIPIVPFRKRVIDFKLPTFDSSLMAQNFTVVVAAQFGRVLVISDLTEPDTLFTM